MAETESRDDQVAREYEPPAIELLGSTEQMTASSADGSLTVDGT